MVDGRTKTGKLINQLSGNNFNAPATENRTPIASDMWLPNHSGISSHPEMLGDNGFVKKTGDTMTGDLTCKSITVNKDLSAKGSIHADGDITALGHIYQNAVFSTPTRALNTVYQNTTGYTIVVEGSVNLLYTDNNSADIAYVDCQTGSANPPTTRRQRLGVTASQFFVLANSAFIVNVPFKFDVPNSHYYRLLPTATGLGAAALNDWHENNK